MLVEADVTCCSLGHLIMGGFLATKNCFIMAPEMRFKRLTRNMAAQRDLHRVRFASKAWPRAGLGEPRSASNANKLASS